MTTENTAYDETEAGDVLSTAVPAVEPVDYVKAFAEIIAKVPYSPSTEQGSGVLPVIVRAMGHVLYLTGRFDEKTIPTGAKAKEELSAAIAHWNEINLNQLSASENFKNNKENIGLALGEAFNNIEHWDKATSLMNTQMLANRMAQLAAILDREFLGLYGSDAGRLL